MNGDVNQNAEKIEVEEEDFFEIPVIIMSSPSTNSDSDATPIYLNRAKRSISHQFQSDEEADTSFIANNNTVNGRVSILRSLSPNSMNASGVSRGNVRRWSQSLTSASKARQNKPINNLPSRLKKLPTALSLDGPLHRIVDNESEFEHFVQEIEQYDYLMENSATAAETRNKILRSLPQTLHIKRQIKSKVVDIVKEKSQRVGVNPWKRSLHFIGNCKIKAHHMIRDFMRNLRLWNDSMKEIEGHFGAGAQTYFRLYRFLFIINVILTIVTFTFIVLPQLLDDYLQQRAAPIPRSRYKEIDEIEEEVKAVDILTAEGAFGNSTLFYGAYTDQRIKLYGSSTYSLPFAYLMTMVCFYSVTFVVFSITTAESYRRSFIATSLRGQALKAHKLFCSWDFGVSNQTAADLKHQNIYFDLRLTLDQLCENECFLTIWQKTCAYTISAVIWVFVVVILFTISSSIIFAAEILEQIDKSGQLSDYLEQSSLLVPIIAVLGLLLCQYLFECFGYLETKIVKMYRSPRSQLHIALVRNYLLNIVTISSLVWFWLSHTEDQKCWETWIAQNIYRLIVIEFFFVICIGSTFRFIRFLIYKFLWVGIGISEFSISRGCLGLIFNQTLLWIGIFFSPPLALIIVIKMIATFYLKKAVLINCCRPPSKLWRSSQTYTLFLSMLFVSLTIVIVISVYILTQMNVSKTCGPFRNHLYMFHVLRGDILKLQENHFLWQLIMFLIRPAAIGLLLLTLCVLVYYLRSKSKARKEMVKLLKQMLHIEAKDKAFLLAHITRITQNNEWLLADFVRPKSLFGSSKRDIDKYFNRNVTVNSNGKFSLLINGENNSTPRKSNEEMHLNRSGQSSNGRRIKTETIRNRRPPFLE